MRRSPTAGCCRPPSPPPATADDVHVGLIFSGDSFYPARPELMKRMVEHGVLAIEMEASALYTIAAGHGRRALAICTVSDHVVTGEETTAEERERTLATWSRSHWPPGSAEPSPPG